MSTRGTKGWWTQGSHQGAANKLVSQWCLCWWPFLMETTPQVRWTHPGLLRKFYVIISGTFFIIERFQFGCWITWSAHTGPGLKWLRKVASQGCNFFVCCSLRSNNLKRVNLGSQPISLLLIPPREIGTPGSLQYLKIWGLTRKDQRQKQSCPGLSCWLTEERDHISGVWRKWLHSLLAASVEILPIP